MFVAQQAGNKEERNVFDDFPGNRVLRGDHTDAAVSRSVYSEKGVFSSAPREARETILPREKELFYGARTIGWTLMIFSVLMILGTGIVSIWDGFRSGFGFWQFFARFVLIFTIYKVYDMVCFD